VRGDPRVGSEAILWPAIVITPESRSPSCTVPVRLSGVTVARLGGRRAAAQLSSRSRGGREHRVVSLASRQDRLATGLIFGGCPISIRIDAVRLRSADRTAVLSLGETIGPILEGPFGGAVVTREAWAGGVIDDRVLVPLGQIVSPTR
jgi:hypothetical protein